MALMLDNICQEVTAGIPGLIYQFRMEPDEHMRFTYISEGSVALLGAEPKAVYGDIKTVFKMVHHDDLHGLLEAITTSARTLGHFSCEFRANLQTGVKWIRATSTPVRADDGAIIWNGLMTDITESRLAANKMTLIRRAVEKAIEGIIITDANLPDNPIIFANRAFYQMTGYSAPEIIGRNCRFLQGADTDPDTVKTMKRNIMEKKAFTTEIINYKKNGQPFWNSLTVVPMLDTDGHVSNYAGFQNDVSERKAAEAKTIAAKEELESFNYTVSHDLQNPLRIMSAFSNILKNEYKDKLDKDAHDYLDFIRNSAAQMSTLIKGLLSFSKMGKAALNFSDTDQNRLVANVVAQCKLNQQYAHAEIICSALDTAICDEDIIKQVWANLISNALKYSAKKEKPQVEIGQYKAVGETVYYVRDNGAGFNAAHSAKLFRPFQRLHSNVEFEGAGIGLATVHKIITQHGGRIWAEGKENEGATFYFTLQEAKHI